jgi:hypothetical protein
LALVGAVIGLSLFLAVEARSEHPMLPLSLFRSPSFSGANLLTLLLYGALSGTLFFLPLNLIQVQQYSATAAGAALLPLILLIFLLSRWAGGLVEKVGAKLPLIVGPLVAAAGFALFIPPGVGGTYWTTFLPPIAVLGTGMALSVAPLTTTVMNSVAASRVGVASGINNAIARSAGLIAIAVFGVVMLQTFDRSLDRRLAKVPLNPAARTALSLERNKLAAATLPRGVDSEVGDTVRRAIEGSFIDGFRVVMGLGAGLAVGSALCAWLLISPQKYR